MESNKSNSWNAKDIIYIFLPLFLAVILQYAVQFGDALVIFLSNLFSAEKTVNSRSLETIMTQDYKQPMNLAYMSLAQYALFILCFGIWYYNAFCKKQAEKVSRPKPGRDISFGTMTAASFRRQLTPLTGLCLLVCGYTAQIFTDGLLALCRPLFPDLFAQYDKLVSNVTGASASWVMLVSVFLLAPVGEELLFRGVLLGYCKRCMPAAAAILLQGLLFGVYHGNLVQGIYAFVLGSALGLLAHKKESVISGILLHIVINVSLLLVPSALFANTVISIITTVIAAAVFIVSLVLLLGRKDTEL